VNSATPQLSVIIAAKNSAATLQRCLDSVFAQRGARFETLVVDGASRDATPAILEANAERLAYRVSEPDSGVYSAWNKALRKARGDWICFVGSDDVLHDDLVFRDLLGHATAKVVYGKLRLVTPRGVVAQTVGRPWREMRADFLGGFMIPHPATLHHRSLFEEHGAFDESYRIAGDYEFVLRELKRGEATFVDRVAVDMRLGGLSVRPDSIHAALREVARARSTHGVRGTSPRFALAFAASWIGARLYRLAGPRAFGAAADFYRVLRGRPRIWTI
jgi:glycosyltransferase involved in cell wall biosynthesis